MADPPDDISVELRAAEKILRQAAEQAQKALADFRVFRIRYEAKQQEAKDEKGLV